MGKYKSFCNFKLCLYVESTYKKNIILKVLGFKPVALAFQPFDGQYFHSIPSWKHHKTYGFLVFSGGIW